MKKIIIFISLILLTSCSLENNKINKNNIKIEKNKQNITKNLIKSKTIHKLQTISTKSGTINKTPKIEKNKNKYEIRGLIISGTIHIKNDEYILALKNFLKAYSNNKGDSTLEKRIADTYYLMKNWKNSFKYYDKINDNDIIYKNKFIYSYFYSLNIEQLKNNKNYLSGTIAKVKSFKLLNKNEKFYYSNSLKCINDFSLCKKNFQDYISKNKDTIYNNKDLENIKIALNNYKNFKIDELYFKNTLVIGGFFKNNLYPIVIILGNDILKEKPNYKPVLKMIAQSYFELGNYKQAKIFLTKYYALDSNDKDVLYILGIISQKTHDYVLSNIYLNKADKLGYKPKSNIDRLQIYNSYILDDKEKILYFFDKLINDQKTPLYNDLILATYYNLINNDYNKGNKYAELGIQLYPKIEDFYGFKGWVLIEKNKLDDAEKILQKGYKINDANPLINLNLGRLEEKKGKKITAMLYYKRTIRLDNGGKISKIAEIYLKNLKKEKDSTGNINT